jgi:hypothetical protein
MAFTGYQRFQQLQLRYKGSKEFVQPPVIKNNIVGDPDYIVPIWKPEVCVDGTTKPQQTTSTSSSSTSSTTIQPSTLDCNDLVLNYGYDCSAPTLNTITFTIGLNISWISVEVHKNNNIIDVKENVPVIGGKASFTVPKTASYEVIFVVRGTVQGNPQCRIEFPALIDCTPSTTTSTTSTTTTTTTTSTSTTSTSTTSTTSTSTSTTSTTSTSTSTTSTTSTSSTTSSTSTTTANNCTATWSFLQLTPCGEDGSYAAMVQQDGGAASNITYGASNTNNPQTVSVWQSSNFVILDGDGLNKYVFVRYTNGVGGQCTQLVNVANRNCTGTTSSSTSTTTSGGGCPGNIPIDVTIPLNNTQISFDLGAAGITGLLNYKVKLGSSTLETGTFTRGSNPNLITLSTMLLGEGITYRLHVFASGCGDGTGKDFVWNPSTTSSSTTTTVGVTSSTTTTTFVGTTSSTTTTTVSGCAGSITTNSVIPPNANQLNVNFTSSLANINWKVKLSGSTLAGGNFPRVGSNQTINLSTITLGAGTTYQLFLFGDGCTDGVGTNFVWNPASTTTSSTTTTTTGAGGCSGVTIAWRYNGQASTPATPYANQADALSAACFGGAGCTGYLNSPTIGQTFYIDKNPASSCTFSGCTTLPTGWYWIYPLSNSNDVYVVHVTSGVIDDVTANPC